MLQIDVLQLLMEPVGSVKNQQVSGAVEIDGNTSQVYGQISLTRTNRSILVKGELNATVELDCARCLNTFSQPLTLDIEEEFFPVTDAASGRPLPPPEEPDAFTIDENKVIDLTEAVRQYGLTAIPMKPLCRQDCPGLQR